MTFLGMVMGQVGTAFAARPNGRHFARSGSSRTGCCSGEWAFGAGSDRHDHLPSRSFVHC